MKKFFLLIAFCFGALSMSADSYRDLLTQYMQVGNLVDKGTYSEMLKPLATSAFPNDAQKGMDIVGQYASSQMITDIIDLFEPAFRNHVSESELQQLVTIMQDPRMQEIQAKSVELASNFNQSPDYQAFMQQYQAAMMQIMQGQKPQEIPTPAGVDKEYEELFNTYYTNSRAGEVAMGAFRSMSGMITNALKQQGVANADEIVKNLIQYTERNMSKVLMSHFSKSFTIEDLQTLNRLTSLPAYTHAMDAVVEVSSNPMKLGFDMMDKMADWMNSDYPNEAEALKRSIKEAQRSLGM